MVNKNEKLSLLVLIIGAVAFFRAQTAHAQEEIEKEILIMVEPNIVELPGNQVSRVPVKYARVRNTELRELNKTYNATEIEKVYETIKVGNKEPEEVVVDDTFIIIFLLDAETNIQEMISQYEALEVVLQAGQFAR